MKTLALLVVAMMAVGCTDDDAPEFKFSNSCEGWEQSVDRCQQPCRVKSQSVGMQTGPACLNATQHFDDGHEEAAQCTGTFEYEGMAGCCVTSSSAPGDVFFLRCE